MVEQLLYKYRSLDNWKFVLDAITKSRLYAATFDSLNDPMEGRYYYFGNDVSQEYKKAILENRRQLRICSLSATRTSTLLWSYYGGSHKGVALGVTITPRQSPIPIVRPVSYDNGIHVRGQSTRRTADAAALDILTQKQMAWQHEHEFRVFTHQPHVRVVIKELVLGCQIDPLDQELICALVKKWHPKVKLTKLNRSMMDVPLPS
jgi:hypothetical protein